MDLNNLTQKQYILLGGSVLTIGLCGASFFKPNLKPRAILVAQHLIYQLLKEFESINNSPPFYSWIYTIILTITELFKIGPFYKHSIASPIMLIRQINPYFDLFFDKRWSVLRLVGFVMAYRLVKGKFSSEEVVDEIKIKED
eukprot:gene2522-3228_t